MEHTFRTSCLLPCESTHLDVQGNPRATENASKFRGMEVGGGGNLVLIVMDGAYMVIH